MQRGRKTEEDKELNTYIGSKVKAFRAEQGWNLQELAGKLDISTPHLNSLENGRYSFSANLLCKFAAVFSRPLDAFVPRIPRAGAAELREQWVQMFDGLCARERVAIMELGDSLTGTSTESLLQCWKRLSARSGCLVSLEGIDGVVLNELSDRLVAFLVESGDEDPVVSKYDFDVELWQFMIKRFRELELGPHRAFERTLFFACERLHRQEAIVRPLLQGGRTVITHFFSLASQVYQQMEELMDTTLIHAVANFLMDPELIVVVDSDEQTAAGRAVHDRPGPGQFYSPYQGADRFRVAKKLYVGAAKEYQKRGVPVHFVCAQGNTDELAAQIASLVLKIKRGKN